MTPPVQNHPCEQCGQLDDHPMAHTDLGKSFHFDCLPHRYVSAMAGQEQHAVILAAREQALAGVHGDELREFIAAQPSDNDVTPTEG